MKKTEKYIEDINHFLYSLCLNEETSKTELTNFLNAYIKFILAYNDLPAEEISVQLHFISKKELNDDEPEYSLKTKHKKKHKQRNKENIKKEQFKKSSRCMAYMTFGTNPDEFDIYLNETLCEIKCLKDVDSLVQLISDIGHEVEHIIQTYKQAALLFAVDLYNEKKLKAFETCAKFNAEDKKLLRKLARKFQKHADHFNVLNSSETQADENSCFYFDILAETILTNATDDDYITFITYIIEGLQEIDYTRKVNCTRMLKQDNLLTRCLIKKFGISADVLNII